MTRDEQVEILARELYVEFAAKVGVYVGDNSAANTRGAWYKEIFDEDRDPWRERAERLVASLAESRIELVAPS